MQRIRKSKHVVLDRDGDTFHIIYYHLDDDGNFVIEHDYPTKNAREAAVHYAGAVAHYIEKEILDTFAAEGYNRFTGRKEPG